MSHLMTFLPDDNDLAVHLHVRTPALFNRWRSITGSVVDLGAKVYLVIGTDWSDCGHPGVVTFLFYLREIPEIPVIEAGGS